MKIDTKDLVFLLNELGISFNQYLFLVMVKEDLYASLYSYEELNVGFTKEEVHDLVVKGYIRKVSHDSNYIDAYEATELFTERLYSLDSEKQAEDFWEEYPPYMVIDNRKIPTKTLDKEKFLEVYSKKVGKFKYLHEKVMEALSYAKTRGMISMGLEKWFLSEQWNEVLREKQKDQNREQFPSERIF